jgi:hypothetical protein
VRNPTLEFEPHGARFDVPLQFTQDLKKTSVLGAITGTLTNGAYFTDRSKLSQGTGLAVVSEVLPAVTDLLNFRVTFPIKHFSGRDRDRGRRARRPRFMGGD